VVVSGLKWYKMFIYNLRRVKFNQPLKGEIMEAALHTIIYTSSAIILAISFVAVA